MIRKTAARSLPEGKSTSFAGGVLDIRYQSDQPLRNVVIVPKGTEPLPPGVIPIEILTRFKVTGGDEYRLQIPLPTTPALEAMVKLELNFQGNDKTEADTFTLNQISFMPIEEPRSTEAKTK
jgi:hypothetical protein